MREITATEYYEERLAWFKEVLLKICDRETSLYPDTWTPDNPLWGQCSPVSLLAKDIFGGDILEARIKYAANWHWHYWNELPDREEDFTKPEFKDGYPVLHHPHRITSINLFIMSNKVFDCYAILVRRYLDALRRSARRSNNKV